MMSVTTRTTMTCHSQRKRKSHDDEIGYNMQHSDLETKETVTRPAEAVGLLGLWPYHFSAQSSMKTWMNE